MTKRGLRVFVSGIIRPDRQGVLYQLSVGFLSISSRDAENVQSHKFLDVVGHLYGSAHRSVYGFSTEEAASFLEFGARTENFCICNVSKTLL